MSNKQSIQKQIDEAWLGLSGINDDELFNPMEILKASDPDYHLKLTWLITQPHNFSFLCKHILNIDILPSQALILNELWSRRFPMLIASRGFGKSFMLSLYAILRALLLPKRKIIIVGAAFRQSKVLFEYMENIWNNSPILRSMCTQNCGPRREVDRCVLRIHDSRIICLPLGDGCLSEGTMVTYKERFGYIEKTMGSIWGNKKFRDIDVPHDNGIKDTLTIKTKMGFEYSGTLNHKMRIVRDSKIIWCRTDEMKTGDRILIDRSHRWHDGEMGDVNLDQCYALGAMIGDGNYTNKYRLRFTTKDNEIIERINSSFVNKKFYQCGDKTHWNLDSKNEVADWLNLWGMNNTYTIDKKIPDKAMSASREQMTEILKGLFDTDGFVTHSESRGSSTYVGFTNTSKVLVQQIQYILLHYGIVAKMYNRNRNKNWNTSYELLITGNDAYKFKNLIGFHLKRKRDILQYAKKTKSITDGVPVDKNLVMDFVSNDGTTISPSIVNRKKTLTHSFLKDVIHKSNKPNQEWFELVDDDIYYDTVIDISKTKHHTYDMHVPDGNEYCANGFFSHNSKIRGQRANDILADEFACLKEGSLVETKNGLIRIEDFDQAASVSLPTGDNQLEFEYPSKFIKTPITDVYEIKLSNGYVIRCSKNHKVMTNNGWKRPLELTSNDWLEQSPNINQNFGKGIDGLDEKTAWLMGLLISEGSVTDKYQLQITNTNINIIQKLVNDYGWKFSTRPAYQDPRGWKCKQSYVAFISDRELREKLAEWGMDYVTAHNKKIPWAILQSNKAVVEAFLSGMFEGDGSCFLWRDREINNRLGLAYYSVSERLCRDVQVLMNKLGYDGYINNRDSEISDNKQWFVRWNNKTAFNAAKMLRVERFNDSISKCSIPKDSTYICWDKSRDRWKVNYSYCGKTIQKRFKTYGDAENLVKELKNRKQFRKVTAVKKLDKQEHLYDYYLPVTHSFFAEGHRQHNSIPRDIFETVVVGFGAVASNPIENVKRIAAEKLAKELDFDLELDEENVKMHDKANQMILSGTAYYDFNHFSAYWKNWHKIINSKGDEKRLKEVFGDEDEPPKDFSWKDYSIIRIPYELLPEGFMDAAQVARSKATIHNGIYQMEYGAVFTSDSQGFFKRSLIESCVASEENNLLDYKNRPIIYDPMLIGDHNKRYIFGIDPASEVDNFSIVVIELNDDHKRIVYCWTTTRSQHREKLKKGYCTETAFYDYCARKIRDLMRLFPCIHIAMDKQGGGVAVMEALHDKDKLQQGEIPIWPVIDPDKEADTDDEKGLHILELCNNSQLDWYIEANHGLRKDFEDKSTLFPQYDALSVSLSNVQDAAKGRMFDTMEECVLEIQELKDELSMIQMTQTANGRDRWDTPEVIVGAGKKEKMRKDRYSALMMANMAARTLMRMPTQADYDFYGGFASLKQDLEIDPDQDLYNGPNWFTDGMRDIY